LNTSKKTIKKALKEDRKTNAINSRVRMGDKIATGQDSDEAWMIINNLMGRARSRIEIAALTDPTTGIDAQNDEEKARILLNHYAKLFQDTEGFNSINWEEKPGFEYP